AWKQVMNNRFFHRGSNPAKNEFEGLRRVIQQLKACGSHTQHAVGAGVHLANMDFTRRFAGIESFRRSSTAEREQFWSDLTDLELGLRSQEVGMAVGVGLYRIWLAETLAGRRNVAEVLGEELTELSRKG